MISCIVRSAKTITMCYHYQKFTPSSQLEGMRSAVEFESKVKAGWIDCFMPERKQLYRTLLGTSIPPDFPYDALTSILLLGMTLQMFQQLTGANYFFYVSVSLSGLSSLYSHVVL